MSLPTETQTIFTPHAVSEAYSLIRSALHQTPILTSTSINSLTTPPLSIYFKAEVFQKTGAFKFRGASHAIARLPGESLTKGVVTHSSGNHSAALACAARERGVKCYVVMVCQISWIDS
jgi:threonine dehydratase